MFDFDTPIEGDITLKGQWDCTNFFEPDLSGVLDKTQLDNLQAIVGAGKASEYLSLGDELKVTYSSYTMPFEVVGFEDIVAGVDGTEKTVHAINLLAKYTNDLGCNWGANNSQPYQDSTLRSVIRNGYKNNLNNNFVECLAKTRVRTYSRDGTTNTVYDELFAPSMAQLGVTNTSYNNAQQSAVEGPAFTAYNGSDNTKRIKQAINATGIAQDYWTRSLYSSSSSGFGLVITSGAPTYNSYSISYRVVAACNFIAKQE